MDLPGSAGILHNYEARLNSQTPLIFIHRFLVHATCCRPAWAANGLTRRMFRVMQKIERERITMIRWNKWTRDYTYTYEWHDGAWRLIHKKSNRPVVHWVKSWYTKPSYLTECGQQLRR